MNTQVQYYNKTIKLTVEGHEDVSIKLQMSNNEEDDDATAHLIAYATSALVASIDKINR